MAIYSCSFCEAPLYLQCHLFNQRPHLLYFFPSFSSLFFFSIGSRSAVHPTTASVLISSSSEASSLRLFYFFFFFFLPFGSLAAHPWVCVCVPELSSLSPAPKLTRTHHRSGGERGDRGQRYRQAVGTRSYYFFLLVEAPRPLVALTQKRCSGEQRGAYTVRGGTAPRVLFTFIFSSGAALPHCISE